MSLARDPFELAARRFERKGVSVYFRDPVGFSRDCFAWNSGESLADYQTEILQNLNDTHRVAVRGPHGLGKTTTKAIALLWFALTRDSLRLDWKVITTAGAWRQLEKFLWPEVHKWARRLRWDVIDRDPFDPINELQTLNLKLKYGAASAVATSHKELIEGAHADQLLYLFDESKAIANDIFDAAEGAFSTDGVGKVEAYALAQSTPGEPQGRFYDIHKGKPGLTEWKTRHVTWREAVAAGRMSKVWFENRRLQWGEDSALFANRAKGEFHSSDVDSVIPLPWVEAAVERWHVWNDTGRASRPGRKVNGVDVARGGADKTVIAERQGDVVMRLHEFAIKDTVAIADRTILLAPNQTDLHVVDVIGVGAGVVDTLRRRPGVNVIAFNAARANHMRDRSGEFKFANNRSYMWWALREALDPAFAPTLALPPHEDLLADLTAPKYKISENGGKIQVESKDDIRARLGRSTDYGDAVGQSLLVEPQFDENYQEPINLPEPYRERVDSESDSIFGYSETDLDWIRK